MHTLNYLLANFNFVYNLKIKHWDVMWLCSPPYRLIRLSSPNLNYLIGGGAIILYMNTYFFIIPTTDPHAVAVLCNITPWLTALGYSFCYGTILAKMVRVYYIFDKPTAQKKVELLGSVVPYQNIVCICLLFPLLVK